MKRFVSFASAVFLLAASIVANASAPKPAAGNTPDALFTKVSKLDAGLFNSFNHCASPDQLRKHASYFAPNVEFYHDTGGVTWSRRDYMANTKDHVCGQFRRVLIPNSLQVFPIKDFGAIEQGRQNFCWLKSGKCFGEAQFLILWHHLDDRWRSHACSVTGITQSSDARSLPVSRHSLRLFIGPQWAASRRYTLVEASSTSAPSLRNWRATS